MRQAFERQEVNRWADEKNLMRNTEKQRHGGLRDIWSLKYARDAKAQNLRVVQEQLELSFACRMGQR